MNVKTFAIVFVLLGILFAILSIYLTMRPISPEQLFVPYGILSTGFISGVCFYVCGMLVKTFGAEKARNEL